MGNIGSACDGFFDKTPTIARSSLNLKYTQDKRNTGISSSKPNMKPSSRTSSLFNGSPKLYDGDLSTRASKKLPSMTVDDFTLVKVLGRGSYGKVYMVQKKSNKRYYALKVINKQDLLKGSLKQTAFTERNVLMRADHPFIVKLKSSFQTDVRIYMVMELCLGGELYLHLRHESKFDENAVKFYASEIILAMQYLHEKLHLIHRDLKPENVLINPDGHIKLTDFGLAKVTIKANSVCGTPEYLAPEVVLRQSYSKVVDWWSVGCLLFEMFTGYPPFSSRDREELNDDIILRSPDIPEEISPELEDLIRKLLCKDPKKRLGFNGAEEVKSHPFFAGVNWQDVYDKKLTPPFIPTLGDDQDVSNFHKKYVEEPVQETPLLLPKDKQDAAKNEYPSFSYLEETLNELDSDEKESENKDLDLDLEKILSDKEDKSEKSDEKIEDTAKVTITGRIIPVDA